MVSVRGGWCQEVRCRMFLHLKRSRICFFSDSHSVSNCSRALQTALGGPRRHNWLCASAAFVLSRPPQTVSSYSPVSKPFGNATEWSCSVHFVFGRENKAPEMPEVLTYSSDYSPQREGNLKWCRVTLLAEWLFGGLRAHYCATKRSSAGDKLNEHTGARLSFVSGAVPERLASWLSAF